MAFPACCAIFSLAGEFWTVLFDDKFDKWHHLFDSINSILYVLKFDFRHVTPC